METPHVVVYDSELNVKNVSEGIGSFFRRWPELCARDDRDVPAAATTFVRSLLAQRDAPNATLTGLLRPTLIVDVVESVHAGRTAIVAAFDTFELRDPVRIAAKRYKLTAREQEVLSLLLIGMGATEIASRLGLSEMTVHAYYTRLRRKTGARTLSGMIATLLGWEGPNPA